MAKFCECCGQPYPGSEDFASLFDGRLIIRPDGMHYDGKFLRLPKSQAYICMAIARTYPRPASAEFCMDYLENCESLAFHADDYKIIDVQVCKIRRQMLDAGMPFHIVTTWGLGKQFAEGPAAGPLLNASHYPRDEWKAERHGNRC